MTLALVVHELATNAVKYGSLSAPDGHVELLWRLVDEGGEARLELEWREAGGPRVVAPARRGFGTEVIERSLRRSGAEVDLRFQPQGLVCRIALRLPAVRR